MTEIFFVEKATLLRVFFFFTTYRQKKTQLWRDKIRENTFNEYNEKLLRKIYTEQHRPARTLLFWRVRDDEYRYENYTEARTPCAPVPHVNDEYGYESAVVAVTYSYNHDMNARMYCLVDWLSTRAHCNNTTGGGREFKFCYRPDQARHFTLGFEFNFNFQPVIAVSVKMEN